MRKFWFARVACFAVVLTFSLIVFGLSTYFVTETIVEGFDIGISDSIVWAELALASSILSLICLTPMIVLDMFLDAHTSKIVVELIVLAILAVLWLASGIDAATFFDGGVPDCSEIEDFEFAFDTTVTLCRSYQAIEAFSWLNWFILIIYTITLLVFTIKAGFRGNRVWMTSVRKAEFFAKPSSSNAYLMAKQNIPGSNNLQNPVQNGQNSYASLPSNGAPNQQYNRFIPEV